MMGILGKKHYITGYRYFQNSDIEGSEGNAFRRDFVGKVNDKVVYWEDFTFIRYYPQLVSCISNTNIRRFGQYKL